MKTLTFKALMSFLAIALMVGFVSCEKSEEGPALAPTQISDNQTSNKPEMGNAKAAGGRHLYMYVDCDPLLGDCIYWPLFCGWPSSNCLPTVIIRGMVGPSDLNILLDHIANDTYDEFFSGSDFERTFGMVKDYPRMHELLKEKRLSFVVERSDTLDRHLLFDRI